MNTNRRLLQGWSWGLLLLVAACATGESPVAANTVPAEIPEANVAAEINKSFKELGPQSDLTPWVERFEVEGREIFDHRMAVLEALRIAPGADVADVGAGTGLFVPLFSRAVGSEGKVYAVDIVQPFLDRIDGRCKEESIANVTTVLCTDRSVSLPEASVDLVFLCDTYHHFEYPLNTLRTIHHALRPGGSFVVVDFDRIEGVSSEFILGHVRAGKEVFRSEIESQGFVLEEEVSTPLQENYFLRFTRTE